MMKVGKCMKDRGSKLIKTLIFFVFYLAYNNIFLIILNFLGISSSLMASFLSDLIFLGGIVFAYKDNLKEDFKKIKNDYSIWKIIRITIFWILVLFIFVIIMGLLTEAIFPKSELTNNTSSLAKIIKTSLPFGIFKIFIFSVVAEELLFKESIRDVIENKIIYILVSGLIYTFMNFIWAGFNSEHIWLDMLIYFLPSIIFNLVYLKHNSNILIIMIIKCCYSLIPLITNIIFLYS